MLQPRKIWDIPAETKRIATKSLPQGNDYLLLRDKIGVIYQDETFAELFIWRGQPAESPGLLSLVIIMQFAEGLTDRQAAEAVGTRIDWKYVLGLEIDAPAVPHSILSDFRSRLIKGGQEQKLFDSLVDLLKEQGWFKGSRRQRTDSTHMLAAIRELNRLELVGETLRAALNDLATVAPEWLVDQVEADWFDLYGARLENYRFPQSQSKRLLLQEQIGRHGYRLMTAIYASQAPSWLREIPIVQVLRQVWVQQFYTAGEQVMLRTKKEHDWPPHHLLIQSPYDPQARTRTKRETRWTGYAVHLTETCEPDQPRLITHCETTPATTADGQMTAVIHQALAAKGLLPEEHLVDTAYVDADLIVSSQQDYHLDLVGPVPPNTSWQARDEQAYDLSCFSIDWEQKVVICPEGHHSDSWSPHLSDHGTPVITTTFKRSDCKSCPARSRCTKSKSNPRRCLTFRPQQQFLALQSARQRQDTPAFKALYQQRAGVEGTISQAVRRCDLRQSRYIGLVKTRLQHFATASALNLARVAAWLRDAPSSSHSRTPRFLALKPAFLSGAT